MEFIDLIKAKDAAIAHDDECAALEEEAKSQLELAIANHTFASEDRAEAHKAIHDLLVERGEHYILDADGTFTVYKASDEPPGYLPVQPIPGFSSGNKA